MVDSSVETVELHDIIATPFPRDWASFRPDIEAAVKAAIESGAGPDMTTPAFARWVQEELRSTYPSLKITSVVEGYGAEHLAKAQWYVYRDGPPPD